MKEELSTVSIETHQRCLCMVVMELDLSFASEGFIDPENIISAFYSVVSKDALLDKIVGFFR